MGPNSTLPCLHPTSHYHECAFALAEQSHKLFTQIARALCARWLEEDNGDRSLRCHGCFRRTTERNQKVKYLLLQHCWWNIICRKYRGLEQQMRGETMCLWIQSLISSLQHKWKNKMSLCNAIRPNMETSSLSSKCCFIFWWLIKKVNSLESLNIIEIVNDFSWSLA